MSVKFNCKKCKDRGGIPRHTTKTGEVIEEHVCTACSQSCPHCTRTINKDKKSCPWCGCCIACGRGYNNYSDDYTG